MLKLSATLRFQVEPQCKSSMRTEAQIIYSFNKIYLRFCGLKRKFHYSENIYPRKKKIFKKLLMNSKLCQDHITVKKKHTYKHINLYIMCK